MILSVYYKPSLFNAHAMITVVHIYTNVNKLCLNQAFSGAGLEGGRPDPEQHSDHSNLGVSVLLTKSVKLDKKNRYLPSRSL